ncbi:MAG: asparaginase [Rhodothermales bacterium]|nr:asparaginase [Rhodothermales bacterium]
MEYMVRILTTGGTIDKEYFDAQSAYQIGEPQIADVLRNVNALTPYTIETLFRKDSLDMNDEDRALVRQRVEEAVEGRILITHGTDTMTETGRALIGIPGKTIVLVGSLSPARFKQTDAEFNIGFAIAAVQTLPEGIYIAMNGLVFDATRVRKNRAANRFEEID